MTNRLSFQAWSVGEICTSVSAKQQPERFPDKKVKGQSYQFVQPLKHFLMHALIKAYKLLLAART